MRINEMLQYYNAFENGNTLQMHNTGKLSNSLIDTQIPKKYLVAFQQILIKRQAFFARIRKLAEGKYSDKDDEKLQFFNKTVENHILCIPFFNKTYDGTLVLTEVAISLGLAQSIRTVFQTCPSIVQHLYLNTNSMIGTHLEAVLEGCLALSGKFKTLTIQHNDVNERCAQLIVELCKRKLPNQLDSLNLYFCKISAEATETLLKGITRCQLTQLSLVKSNLNELSLKHLTDMIEANKRLKFLDISWNSLPFRASRKLLEVLASNRKL